MAATRLRKGDLVKLIAGEDKGKSGKILRVDRKNERVYVEQLKMIKRRQRPTQKNPQAGVIQVEGPIHWSNVMFVDAATGKPVRAEKTRKQAA